MTIAIEDRVKDTTTTTGTGALTTAGAVTGFRSVASVLTVGQSRHFAVVSASGTEWEVGRYTYSAANTLTRTEIFASSNGGAAVNFSAGPKTILLTFSAAQIAKLASADDATTSTIADLTAARALIEEGGQTKRIALADLITQMGSTPSDLTSAGTLQGTDVITVRRSGVDYQTTLASVLAYIVANGGGGSGVSAPGQVTGLTSTATTSSSVSLSFTAPGSGGAPTDYIVEYKAASSGTWLTFSDGTSTATTPVVTGLSASTSYNFRVSATNSGGTGPVSSTYTVSTAAASGPTYILTSSGAAGAFPSSSSSITPGYATELVRIYVKTAGNAVPAGVNFMWSTSSTVAPTTYSATNVDVAHTQDRRIGIKAGGWSGSGDSYYGLWQPDGTLYAWGAAGTYYLWIITDDGFSAPYDNGTGTPIGWVLTA